MLQKFFICCAVRLQCLIHLSRGSTLCSNRQSSASPTLSSPTFSGFRPVSQSQMVVLGSDVCLRSHFPPFLASAASTLSLQDDILTECAHSNSNFLQSCLADWSAKFGDVPDILPTKQPIWDSPGVLESKAKVEASLASAHHRASFLAASCQHSGDWLLQ